MIARVAVLDDWLDVAAQSADWARLEGIAEVEFFSDPITQQDAPQVLQDFDIVVPMRERMPFPRVLLEHLPKLKLLALTGHFAPFVDTDYCAKNGILLCGSGVYTPFATAELTFALILASMRHLSAAERTIRSGKFQKNLAVGRTLAGKTMGIVGLGHLGSQVAKYAQAFGMSVIAWSTNLTQEKADQAGARAVDKESLFRDSDVVSLHLKYSPRTHHIVGVAELGVMKQGALLVNTARSGLVMTEVLVEALYEGRIFAALDVYDIEPVAAGAAILQAPGMVLTPHIGFSTDETFHRFYEHCVENIEAFLAGSPIRIIAP